MIGRLLGHSELQTTERYAHLDREWVREAAVRVSESIAADVLTGYPGHRAEPGAHDGSTESAGERVRVTDAPPFRARFRSRLSRAA